MSKDKISDYSATANSNTDIGGINIDEGCAPSGINDAIRTLMKQLKDFQQGTQSDVFKGPLQVGAASSIEVTDNTNAALRITQLGTGNALLVEDSTNPDSTPFVIDASGNVIIGNTTVDTGGGKLEIFNSGSDIYTYLAGTGAYTSSYFKSRSATLGTQTVVVNGDALGGSVFYGSDGTSFINAAQILAYVDGTPGTNDMPGRLVFFTTADGASSPTERMRIDSDGLVSLKNSGGLSIAQTAVTSPATTDGNVFSGTYTPTLTNVTNVAASTTGVCQYMRVGNAITVSGQLSIDPTTAATDTVLRMTLPIASDFSGTSRACGGTFASLSNVYGEAGSVLAYTNVTGQAEFRSKPSSASNQSFAFTFTYRII